MNPKRKSLKGKLDVTINDEGNSLLNVFSPTFRTSPITMTSQRDSPVLFSRRLDKTERQLEALLDLARKTNDTVQSLRPQHELPAIPRPKQKRDFNRSCNVVDWLRTEIDRRNASLPEESSKYRQFPKDVEDTRISSDAQKCLEILAMFHLDTEYGQCTWDQAMINKPRECAAILREARQTPELSVFCQTAGLWGIDMLLKSKLKSKLRSIGRAEQPDAEEITNAQGTNEDQNEDGMEINPSHVKLRRNTGQRSNIVKYNTSVNNQGIGNHHSNQQNGRPSQMEDFAKGLQSAVMNNGLTGNSALLASSLQAAVNSTFTHRSPFQQQPPASSPDCLQNSVHPRVDSNDQLTNSVPISGIQNAIGIPILDMQSPPATLEHQHVLNNVLVQNSVNGSGITGNTGNVVRGRVARGRGTRGRSARGRIGRGSVAGRLGRRTVRNRRS